MTPGLERLYDHAPASSRAEAVCHWTWPETSHSCNFHETFKEKKKKKHSFTPEHIAQISFLVDKQKLWNWSSLNTGRRKGETQTPTKLWEWSNRGLPRKGVLVPLAWPCSSCPSLKSLSHRDSTLSTGEVYWGGGSARMPHNSQTWCFACYIIG